MEVNGYKFWTPRNNEWHNFAIYKDSKLVMKGDVCRSSVSDYLNIFINDYSTLTKDEIVKIVNMFRSEFIKVEAGKLLTINCEIEISIKTLTGWIVI